MSLKSYFPEQFDQLTDFMVSPSEVLRCMLVEEEMKSLLMRALMRMEDDSEFPHALFYITEKFEHPVQYFESLYEVISAQFAQIGNDFPEIEVDVETPFDLDDPPLSPFKFLRFTESLADELPNHVGSLVFVLDPEAVEDSAGYQRVIRFLSERTQSEWLKFIVLDSPTESLVDAEELDKDKVQFQNFHLSPEEIEKRTKQDLENADSLEPRERRQYLGLLAGFLCARSEFDEAEDLQRQWVTEAQRDEAEPAEIANALYCLGNTLQSSKRHAQAIEVYCKACDLCVEHKVTGLAPMTYTNLGISLYRYGDKEKAYSSLKVARDMFKAQNMLPGEAHVVDTLAQLYMEDDRSREAEDAWRYTLTLYEKITADQFQGLRDMGVKTIHSRLEELYEATHQADKLIALKQSLDADGNRKSG